MLGRNNWFSPSGRYCSVQKSAKNNSKYFLTFLAELQYFSDENETIRKSLQPDSLSVILEECSSQLNNSSHMSDKSSIYEEAAGISFSFDGKEVSISLYETPDLTEDEALQIVEMYANELTEHISGMFFTHKYRQTYLPNIKLGT